MKEGGGSLEGGSMGLIKFLIITNNNLISINKSSIIGVSLDI